VELTSDTDTTDTLDDILDVAVSVLRDCAGCPISEGTRMGRLAMYIVAHLGESPYRMDVSNSIARAETTDHRRHYVVSDSILLDMTGKHYRIEAHHASSYVAALLRLIEHQRAG